MTDDGYGRIVMAVSWVIVTFSLKILENNRIFFFLTIRQI